MTNQRGPADEVFSFIGTEAIGCRFATIFARQRQRSAWLVTTCHELEEVVGLTESALGGFSREAALLVFPGRRSSVDAVHLINVLCGAERWHWERVLAPPGEPQRGLMVGLRYRIPTDDYTSYVLGLAPFEPMPATRRAPHLAVAIRFAGPHPNCPRDTGEPVHLCDMHIDVTKEQFDRVWDQSEQLRSAAVGDRSWGAKAAVSFVLPPEMEADLVAPAGEYQPVGPSWRSGRSGCASSVSSSASTTPRIES